ncbi:MAG: exodeoxyribonuclease III [Flavobacteriales bacterium]|nr:exodeoxyribonuclease III [Flavobacteriales bacterium]
MKIISYNINGIRSGIRKGLVNWISEENPDVICLQEIKANTDQFDVTLFEHLGYHCYWLPAQKKGYSGVAILSKKIPHSVSFGCGDEAIDSEGRIIKICFSELCLFSCYFPSGSSGEVRQAFKMHFLNVFLKFITNSNLGKNIIISGDFNICHKEIDIHNPKANKNTSGFLPEERAWMDDFLNLGFVDSFRYKNKNPNNYSWWSYRANSRLNNKGWRIDYHMVSDNLKDRIIDAAILDDVCHSDHCPISLLIK